MALRELSDQELLSNVTKLVGSHRELTARLVVHLAEIEERRLHLVAGYPSMFAFCVGSLGFSEGEAFRRIVAARVARRFPVICSLLASGAVHLSALVLLRERLTEENHAELFELARGKSNRQIEASLAAGFPRPDVPSRIRRAPIEPLSEARFKVEFTASAELREKLELCRDLMSHANPSRDLAVVVERGVDLLLADLERKRLGRAKRPRAEPPVAKAKVRRVTRATRRNVFERDGLQCTYVSPDGRRCDARAFLELDHSEPRGLGGDDGAENLRVRCRAHNQLAAEQVYGREHVERSRHLRQRKSTHAGHQVNHEPRPERSRHLRQPRQPKCISVRSEGEPREREARPAPPPPTSVLEKVRVALTRLGFRDAQARKAVAEVEERHDEIPSLEQALREALIAATAMAA